LAVITRKAMSSWQRRSIARDERSPDRVAVEQQRHHHRRLVRRAAPAVLAIGRIERGQIELGDRLDHEPRQVALGQPLANVRRQQQLLLAIAPHKVLRHAGTGS
jgi:hypothetical protein